MITLAETFSHKGITLETVTAYVRYYIDAHGQEVWQHHLTEIEQRYQQAGNQAYGLYSQTLFRPLEEELRAAGLTCDPRLPGTFSLSREHWGAEEARERRFWCVLRKTQGEALGTLVTRFVHDETQLRMPQLVVLPCTQTNPVALAMMIELSTIPGLEAVSREKKGNRS